MSPPSLDRNDELLRPFLNASTDEEDDVTVSALLEIAQPIIYNVLRRKLLLLKSDADVADDLISVVRIRLLEQLRKCKHSYEEGDEEVVIRHFPGLCQVVAANSVNEHLRLKYPRRASLQNQLLYLLREAKDGANLPLFASWRDADEHLCGFRPWEGRKFVLTQKHQLLGEDSGQAMRQALPGESVSQLPLLRVMEALFRWLASPAVFDSVVGTTAQWRGVEDRGDVSLSAEMGEEGAVYEPVAPDLSPEERAIFSEYLGQVWRGITELPPKQRTALLLNFCDAQGRGVLGFLPTLGIATFHEIAATLEMDVREFAALWPKLPMEDSDIAQIYGCTPAVIAVWRSRARARLKKNLEES
ncbi:sigma-70 family RNA polymerase sigma factor [bacterium]|nr:MAG: sigma-70 family RNA polymerase sigma factor [bacterium]